MLQEKIDDFSKWYAKAKRRFTIYQRLLHINDGIVNVKCDSGYSSPTSMCFLHAIIFCSVDYGAQI